MPPPHLPSPGAEGDIPPTHIASPSGPPTSGKFRFLRPCGRGGLGTVSVVRDGDLNREVALKEIHTDLLENQECQARFRTEAEISSTALTR